MVSIRVSESAVPTFCQVIFCVYIVEISIIVFCFRSRDRDKQYRKKINLFDTPMEIRNALIVGGVTGEEVEFPSWTIRRTRTKPSLTYSLNPSVDKSLYISRQEMLDSLPQDINQIVLKFFESLQPKR